MEGEGRENVCNANLPFTSQTIFRPLGLIRDSIFHRVGAGNTFRATTFRDASFSYRRSGLSFTYAQLDRSSDSIRNIKCSTLWRVLAFIEFVLAKH